MKDCLFCQFAKGEGSFHKIYEDQDYLAVILEPAMLIEAVVFPRVHLDKSGSLADNELSKFIKFSRLIEVMIRRAYSDVEYVGSVYNWLGVNHYHEIRFPIHQTSLVDSIKIKNLPKTAAGIAQRIKNWAPKLFTLPEKNVHIVLPECIYEIMIDGSLLARDTSELFDELSQKIYHDKKPPTQEEIDEIINRLR